MKKYLVFALIGCVVVLAGLGCWRYSEAKRHEFKIVFLNVGQGDGALIQFRDGQTMLVDCGPDSKVLSELGNVLPWYVRRIDYLLVTHPDADHYAGCIDVLRRYDVAHIITNGESKKDALYATFAQAVHDEPNSVAFVPKLETISFAGTKLEFFTPDPGIKASLPPDDSNNGSIVFRLTDDLARQTVLFTGDMEEPLEQALLKKYCPDAMSSSSAKAVQSCPAIEADVLKVGHHGSDTSTGERFLAAVAPKTAIISVGVKNKFGHPSLRVLKRLERERANILRTDQRGAIVISSSATVP